MRGLDDEEEDARVLGDVGGRTAHALMVDGLNQRTAADRAVESELERTRAGLVFMCRLPADPKRSGVTGERFCLDIALARPAADGSPRDRFEGRGCLACWGRGASATGIGAQGHRDQE